jgi:hypothetical protein
MKADTETGITLLLSKIWKKEEIPDQWKEGFVIKLPKRGPLGLQQLPRHHAHVSAG